MKKLLYILILLAIGNTALAANTWTVQYLNGKFKISRSGDTSISETVQYRTVSLSAIAGQHFTAKTGTLTFAPDEADKEVSVTENTPGTAAYLYQNGTSREYRFEVLDQGGFRLASCYRTITTGTSVPSSNAFAVKDITIQSGEYTADDAGYKENGYKSVGSSAYFTSSNAPKAYLQYIGAELRMTLSLQAKENDDAYEYLQLLFDNTSTCDDRSGAKNGDPGTPNLSRYMAGFEMNTGSKDETYRTYTFPILDVADGGSATNPWGYGTAWPLSKQKFKSGSRATDGRIIVPMNFSSIVLRLNASGGSGSDEWAAKNVVAHIQAVDGTAPSRLGDPVVSGSMHAKGNTFYVSVPFDEIVIVTGTPTLSTTWGSASYVSTYGGSGSNVLTFSGTITASAGTALTVQSISGTIKDLANNELSSSSKTINKSYGTTVDASATYSITYDLAGGTLATDNPDSYTYETAAFTLNNPARTGYWFDGWTGSNGSTPSTTVTIANHSHENKTFTANWTKVWTGSGTQGDPYVISSTKGLNLLAMYVNGLNGNTANDCSGVYFQLGGNIAYSPTDAWNLASSQEDNYTAIGTNNNPFKGTFDGQNHTISGIRIYKPNNDRQGIFGCISGGTASDVNLADARITGKNYVGGIAGSITSNSIVKDCTVASEVCIHTENTSTQYLGGIAGHNNGIVRRCLSRATITDNNASGCSNFGAIIGYNAYTQTIEDCIAIDATVPNVENHGAIIGNNNNSNSYYVQRNYYRACTVAGTANATGVGVGSDRGDSSPHDLTANQGAQALYSITLPDGVSLVRTAKATLPGTGNATYTIGADIDGTPYAYDGATLRLSYSGDAPAEGYSIALYVNGVQATDNGDGTYTATMPAADATVTVSTVAKDFTADGHSGDSESDAYIIYNKDQLDLLAKMVNGTDGYAANTFEGKYIKLAADITYSYNSIWNANSSETNYTGIGKTSATAQYYFRGTFDGDGHTVSGIRIHKSGTTSVNSYQALFGMVGNNGTVKNVTVSDMRITGLDYVGGVVGYNYGLVQNCHVTGTVRFNGLSSNKNTAHGGIVGSNGGTVEGCTSAASFTTGNLASDKYYGGVVGYNYSSGTIRDCLALGISLPSLSQYLGTIVGRNNDGGTLTANHYRECTVAEIANATNVGVGSIDGGASASADQAGARSVHALTLPAGVTASGESVIIDATTYYAAGTTVTLSHGSVPAGYEAFEGYSLNGTPFDGDSFTMPAADATVTARWTVIDFETGHAGTEADPYIIYNKEQLDLLASRVNSGTNYSGKFIKLGADITYDGMENNYTPIGTSSNKFRGTFDGDGHTISGINITGENDYQGLFGYIFNGTVKNVTLANSRISGKRMVGGIAGYIGTATISNCRVESTVTVAAGSYLGSIVGTTSVCTIDGCISAATVTNAESSGNYCGGIVGFNSGTVKNCLVSGGSITITAVSSRGAIVGQNNSGGALSNNYYYNFSVNSSSSNIGCNSSDVTDNDGAVRAISSTTKPAEIGAQIASYSNGLTVYEHGAYYNGTYYLRHDLAGTAVGLTLTQGTKYGVSAYWGTFYDGTTNQTLVGATAYTLGTDFKLYRLGTDGCTIPKGVAVVIIAPSADASLVPAGTGDLSITDHALGGNILVGNDAATSYPTIYVLSVSAGEVGFRKLSSGTLPAHKAGYELQGGMQDYDKQGNQEW